MLYRHNNHLFNHALSVSFIIVVKNVIKILLVIVTNAIKMFLVIVKKAIKMLLVLLINDIYFVHLIQLDIFLKLS